MPRTVTDMVAEQRDRIENMPPARLHHSLASAGTTVVDVRESEEVAATGTIPSAVCVPRGVLEFRADPTSPTHDPLLDPGARTIVYCASGGRSALAAGTLLDLGYEHVAHLDGGIAAWVEAGFELLGGEVTGDAHDRSRT